ncbi:hypothetical protein ABIB35_003326 [Arthrobacter sp. UYP6]|uniref:hypothetical protein n=1 Tax=Arthrobacter sp. UYP6 TaxID=1756378 RepID=UPI003397E222
MSQHREAGEIPPGPAKPELQETGSHRTSDGNAPSPSPQAAQQDRAAGSSGIWPPVASPAPPVQQPPSSIPGNKPEPIAPRPSRKHLVFGAAGLGLGLLAGIGLGQINIPLTSHAIEAAAETCSVSDTFGVDMGDNGQSISMSSEGEDSAGAEYADITCVLAELEVPDSVETRIGTTRALDGRQSAEWDTFAASWGYHPDSGLNIVVEVADKVGAGI